VNPVTGALKYISTTTFNALLALIFFIISARLVTPDFVGKVTIIQLVETLGYSIFALIPPSFLTREITHNSTKNPTKAKGIIYTTLSFALISSFMYFLVLLFYHPFYLILSLPYLILYLFSAYQSVILNGLGKFTEANLGNAAFFAFRWGFSILALFYNNLDVLIISWTIGALIRTIYYQLQIMKIRLGSESASSTTATSNDNDTNDKNSNKATIFSSFNTKIFKELVLAGLPLYISNVIAFISTQGDRILTVYFLGEYDLGIYQLVALASTFPVLISQSISASLIPSSTYYWNKGVELSKITFITFKFTSLFFLLFGIIGFVTASTLFPLLFPEYSLGIPSFQLLFLFMASFSPFQLLSSLLIVLKKSYKPFIIIGVITNLEIIALSFFLIPPLGIYGAAISQAVSVVTSSALLTYFSVSQGIFRVNNESLMVIFLIAACISLTFIAWWVGLLLSILGFRLLRKSEVDTLMNFLPKQLRGFAGILYLISRHE